MAIVYETLPKWKDRQGNVQSVPEGEDIPIGRAYGVLVHAYDEDNPENQRFWWSYTGEPQSWTQWRRVIENQIAMYGLEVTGGDYEPPPDDEPDDDFEDDEVFDEDEEPEYSPGILERIGGAIRRFFGG